MVDSNITLDEARRRVIDGMRGYADAGSTERTGLLRDIAEAMVEARAHHFNKDGEPDWAGRTHAYRMWVRDATVDAGITPAERTNLQAAIRWHLGAVLRERVPAEALEAAGLSTASPRERGVQRRAEAAETRNLIGPGPEIRAYDDLVTLLDLFDVTMRRIPVGIIDTFTASERRHLAEAMEPVASRFNDALGRVRLRRR